MTALKDLIEREKYIEKVGVANIEFSNLLDMFRDERKDIKELIARLEEAEGMIVGVLSNVEQILMVDDITYPDDRSTALRTFIFKARKFLGLK
jgi:hypothetical protein